MTSIGSLEFTAVVMCDDIRREITNKDILIGAYAGYVLVPEYPAQIPISFWMEVEPHELGAHPMQFRIYLTGKEPVQANVVLQVHELDAFGFSLPALNVLVEGETEIHLEAMDGEEWKLLKRKQIRKGAIPNLIAPIASQPPA